MYVLDHAALTHQGTVRELNEDSVLDRPPVFLVADGIGGHEAGEVASALVVAAFTKLLDAGVTNGEQAAHHPGRHLVTRAVGTQEGVQPDFWMRPLVPGERLLLCTDGLLENGLTDELTALACASGSASDTAKRLLDLSLTSGAKDNVSVVVVQVVGVDPGPEHAHAIEHEGAP